MVECGLSNCILSEIFFEIKKKIKKTIFCVDKTLYCYDKQLCWRNNLTIRLIVAKFRKKCSTNCFSIHHILQICPPLTISCSQTSREYLLERNLAELAYL